MEGTRGVLLPAALRSAARSAVLVLILTFKEAFRRSGHVYLFHALPDHSQHEIYRGDLIRGFVIDDVLSTVSFINFDLLKSFMGC